MKNTDVPFLKKSLVNKMDTNTKGRKGEDFATEFYQKTGCRILERNYHSRYGEIDLIAEKDNLIIFVEVKTRSENSIDIPSASVTKSKIKKIILTAMKYMEDKPENLFSRFDVFEVWQREGRIYKFNRIESAFEAEDFSGRYDIF